MHDDARVPRHTAMYHLMNGADEKFLWDKTCLSQMPDVESGVSIAGELGAYIAMYMRPGGDTEFMYMNVGGTTTEPMFALALSTMTDLPAWVQEKMRLRDHKLVASGGFEYGGGTTLTDAVLARVLELLPPTAKPPLPVAYAAITSIFGTDRTHLDFWCHQEVPIIPVWKTFQANVATGLIGL